MSVDWTKLSQFRVPEDSTGYLLWQVMHAWQRQIEGALADLQITHLQFVLLAGIGWLTRNEDLLTQVGLAAFCKIDGMQVSQVVRRLETKELVQRAAHPTDTRAKTLTLTAKGEIILQQAIPIVEQLDASFFSHCDPFSLLHELKTLHQAMLPLEPPD
jgi:DNA-binding MarR family transcriptional regulator